MPDDGSTPLVENFTGPRGAAPPSYLLTPETGGNGWGNNELESYTARPQNAELDGKGDLVITARREAYRGADGISRNWTSARLYTLGKFSFTTGTVSARIKVPSGTGLWPAFWFVGSDITSVGWPQSGEIDVLETLNSATKLFQSVHGPIGDTAYQTTQTVKAPGGSLANAFHTYALTRSPGKVVLSLDGKVTAVLNRSDLTKGQRWVFDGPMFLILNLAVGGDWPGPPSAATPASSSMLVDWIRFDP